LFKYLCINLNIMNSFSISELQKFSGIKAHTIRTWEQRYNALKPNRSEGNTRYYNGSQLRRLLNIVSLLNTDYKVSELCSMPDKKLVKLLDEKLSQSILADHAYEYFISQIISATIQFNEMQFDKLFANCILRFGLKGTYVQIIYPALVRLGIMWSKDAILPAQEHFITNLIRQKVLAVIDALPIATTSTNSWLLFLPEDEFHEAGLLLSNFLIRQAGMKVIYLGANVPYDSLKLAIKEIKPTHILFFLVRKNNNKEDMELINILNKNFPTQKIYLGCDSSRLNDLKTSKYFTKLHSVQDLENKLQQIIV